MLGGTGAARESNLTSFRTCQPLALWPLIASTWVSSTWHCSRLFADGASLWQLRVSLSTCSRFTLAEASALCLMDLTEWRRLQRPAFRFRSKWTPTIMTLACSMTSAGMIYARIRLVFYACPLQLLLPSPVAVSLCEYWWTAQWLCQLRCRQRASGLRLCSGWTTGKTAGCSCEAAVDMTDGYVRKFLSHHCTKL